MGELLALLVCLQLKHFILDFVFQPPFMYQNKGTYGHLGGIAHSAVHAFATAALLLTLPVSFGVVVFLALLEFVIHYHMDWFKMWYGKRQNWTPQTEQFWVFLGLDQLVHQLNYLLTVAYIWLMWVMA